MQLHNWLEPWSSCNSRWTKAPLLGNWGIPSIWILLNLEEVMLKSSSHMALASSQNIPEFLVYLPCTAYIFLTDGGTAAQLWMIHCSGGVGIHRQPLLRNVMGFKINHLVHMISAHAELVRSLHFNWWLLCHWQMNGFRLHYTPINTSQHKPTISHPLSLITVTYLRMCLKAISSISPYMKLSSPVTCRV